MFKSLGQVDVYIDTLTKWFSRTSSVMVWIGFFTYMSTMFELSNLALILAGLIILIVFVVWLDVKYILPSRQQFLGNKNPYLNEIKKDVKEILETTKS
jgi:hypothetical protein